MNTVEPGSLFATPPSAHASDLLARVYAFMQGHVLPNEKLYEDQLAEVGEAGDAVAGNAARHDPGIVGQVGRDVEGDADDDQQPVAFRAGISGRQPPRQPAPKTSRLCLRHCRNNPSASPRMSAPGTRVPPNTQSRTGAWES